MEINEKILTVKVALVDYYIIAHKHTCLVFQWYPPSLPQTGTK